MDGTADDDHPGYGLVEGKVLVQHSANGAWGTLRGREHHYHIRIYTIVHQILYHIRIYTIVHQILYLERDHSTQMEVPWYDAETSSTN